MTRRGHTVVVLIGYETYEGLLATRDEMSFPDWRKRLLRAKRESRDGKGAELETFLRKSPQPR